MNYFLVVLPKALDGSINRQLYAFTDIDSARQSFHAQCSKYFNNPNLVSASVCMLDEKSNKLMHDYWERKEEDKTEE